MKDLNKIILIGRLGTNPVQRETKSGTAVTHFSLATSRKILREDASSSGASEVEETVWHNVVVWGRQAEICTQYLVKGRAVYVEGSIRKRNYTAKDGTPRMSFEVHAESVGFLDGGKNRRVDEKEVDVNTETEVAAAG